MKVCQIKHTSAKFRLSIENCRVDTTVNITRKQGDNCPKQCIEKFTLNRAPAFFSANTHGAHPCPM